MTEATPEQVRVFRRRRLIVTLGSIGIFLLGGLLGLILIGLSASRKYHLPMDLSAGSLVFVWLGISALKAAFRRCPICDHRLPKFATRCYECNVSFQGEAKAQHLVAGAHPAFWWFVVAISVLAIIGVFWLFCW